MSMDAMTRKLTTAALAGAVGLALAAAPGTAQQADDARQAAPPAEEQPRQIQVRILGMSCPFCAYGAQQKLKKLDGVKDLKIELKSGIATLTMKEGADASNEKLKKLVEQAGFEADAIVRSFGSEYEDVNPEEMPGKQGSGETSSGPTSGTPSA